MSAFVMGVEYVTIRCGHDSHGPGDFAFAVTRAFYDETRRAGLAWYCPMGHRRIWTGATTETQLEQSKAREVALKDQLSAAIRDAEQTRAALLRDRARFAAGVCPCCNRSFDNVRRHMVTQHPDYDATRLDRHASTFRCSCGRAFRSFQGLRTHQGWQRHEGWDSPTASRWSAHLTEVKA